MKTRSLAAVVLLTFVLAWAPLAPAAASTGYTTLFVDATDAPRNLLHVEETIAVAPGSLTLFYPKWIPGEHGPTGPVVDVAGLKITAGNAVVPWRRDPTEMHAITLMVPAGADRLDLRFDFILPPSAAGFTSGASSSTQLVVINWNQVVFYPLALKPDDLVVAPSLTLPAGWKFATALRGADTTGVTTRFAPVSLTTLVDSPVIAGAHFRRFELNPGGQTPVFLNLSAESEAALAVAPETLTAYRRLVHEAGALFGATHYGRYEFLYTLSDQVAHFGMEHHESSDNRTAERSFLDEDQWRKVAGLLPHEYVHSWNGKFRRPAGLATADFSTPYDGELLWVYEGLTNYLGVLLTARSGLWTAEELRGAVASSAAWLNNRPGRTWRPLQDTADEAQLLYGARSDYDAWRRHAWDFYDEGTLLWLEVDVTIRQRTGGRKSLDDFCRAFCGGVSGPPAVKSYTFADVVAALNGVAPHDWQALLTERLQSLKPTAPLGGIEQGGWRLVFKDEPTSMFKSRETVNKQLDARYSLGVVLKADGKDDGALVDVIPGSPAALAGLAPGMKIIAVNGRRYSADVMKDALKAGVGKNAPLALMAENREFFSTHHIDYHGGERYPHLERDESKPDVLAQIFAPLVPPAQP